MSNDISKSGSLRLAYSENRGVIEINRLSLDEAFARAALGEVPHQPHSFARELQSEALIGTEVFNRDIRPLIKAVINSTAQYSQGPVKDLARAAQKKSNLGENCDYARGMFFLKDMDVVQKAIDIFGRRGTVSIQAPGAANTFPVHILDVDNSFSKPSAKKPGFHNLDIKIAVPISVDGVESYHIMEVQFRLKSSAKAYEASEESYKKSRYHLHMADLYAEGASRTNDPDICRRLGKRTISHAAKADFYMDERARINEQDELLNGTDSLVGYTPSALSGKGWSYKRFIDAVNFEQYEAEEPVAAEVILK